jgi:hypothetical protein
LPATIQNRYVTFPLISISLVFIYYLLTLGTSGWLDLGVAEFGIVVDGPVQSTVPVVSIRITMSKPDPVAMINPVNMRPFRSEPAELLTDFFVL